MSDDVKIVHLNGVYAQLQGLPPWQLKVLHESFRFRKPNWQFSGMQRGARGWDGYTNFLSAKTGKFLAGLVPEIEVALQEMDVPYKVFRKKGAPLPLDIDQSKIHPHMVTVNKRDQVFPMRDYQIEYVWRMFEEQRGIIVSPTGSGKTAIVSAYLKLIEDYPTLVMFRSQDLLDQSYEEFIAMGVSKKRLGICNAKVWQPGRVVLTTAQSLHHLEEVLPEFRALLADECHNGIVTNSVVPYLKKMKKCTHRFAISATPWKKKDQVHNYKLKGHFGPQLGDLTTHELQNRGILSQSRNVFIEIDFPDDTDYEKDYISAYREYLVENYDFHDYVAKFIQKLKGRTLVLVEWKDHGIALSERVPGMVWISGEDKKDYRREVREQLRNAPQLNVCSTKIFGTGMDIYVHNVVNLSGGASDIELTQKFGRGLRLAKDKDAALYVDIYWKIHKDLERHSEVRIKELQRMKHKVEIYPSFEAAGLL